MKSLILTLTLALAGLAAAGAMANPARDAIVADFAAQAKAADEAFTGFSRERGAALFTARHMSGKPETPSCTTCHGDTPFSTGQTRAGKIIEPMAVSKKADRYTDPKKVAKWFYRNCRSVLGRECTALEKGDYLTFMISR